MSHLQILPGISDRVGDPLVSRFLDMREKLRWLCAMGGERVLLYKKMWFGTYSPYYDPIRNQTQVIANDNIGYGTPFVGGYYGPFEIYVSFKTAGSPQVSKVNDQGVLREFASTSWALWEPLLNNMDFIVRRNNARYWLNSVDVSKWRHHVLRQIFTCTEIERSNPIYNIPITGLPGNTTGLTCPIIPPLP